MEIIKTIPHSSWQDPFSRDAQTTMTTALENGQVLFFPRLDFQLSQDEQLILTPDYVCKKSKNISFNKLTGEIRGVSSKLPPTQLILLQTVLNRFAKVALHFTHQVFPRYKSALKMGRTSFRPVEVSMRKSSYRKDDKRLHVDAFPANPNHGLRILRVFSNINPSGEARVWRLGEPFEEVVERFLPRLKKPLWGSARFLYFLKITKQYRTLYDHYMLQLHNKMKADNGYQQHAPQQEFHFPPGTTWLVQTDHVSHAAMSGQYLLEQTFYLPVKAMLDEAKSPLRILEKKLNRSLTSLSF